MPMTGTSNLDRVNQENRMEETRSFQSWNSGVDAPGEWLLEAPAESEAPNASPQVDPDGTFTVTRKQVWKKDKPFFAS